MGEKIDQKVFRIFLAEVIIRHGYSFSFVEHESVRKLFKYLNDKAEPVSRNTIKTECLKVHMDLKGKILSVLKGLPGRICLTCDLWTACTARGYLCVTAQYIDENWKLLSKVLCFQHCPPPHGGYELSTEICKVLPDWGIENKIFSLTVDNASNMDKMMNYLKEGGLKDLLLKGKYIHMRCSAHVLNLIVKVGLGAIEGSILKVREGIKYIDGSEGRLQKFQDLFKNSEISYTRGLWLDVPTRWNSTYQMLDRALTYRVMLNRYFAEMDGDASKYHIGYDEWEKIEKICELLKPFNEITNLFSRSDYPTANFYFPKAFIIHCQLKEAIESDDVDIRIAAAAMLEKFQKYWSDYVLVLAFAMIFDPRYKLKFVCFALAETHGEAEGKLKVKEVKKHFEELYKEYKKLAGGKSSSDMEISPPSKRQFHYDKIAEFAFKDKRHNVQSEIDTYLGEQLLDISEELDVLLYWKQNSGRFPILSAMARDILAIPITYVAYESTFSMRGRILSQWRSFLLPKNVNALVTTKNWLTGYDDFTIQGVNLQLASDDWDEEGEKN